MESKYLKIAGLTLQLPDTPWPEANEMLQAYRMANKARRETGDLVQRMEVWKRRVKQEDLELQAEALASGTPAPVSKLEEYQRAIDEQRQLLPALEAVRARRAEEFLDHLAQHLDEYRRSVVEQIREPVELSTAGIEQLQLLLSWKGYLDRFPRKCWALLPAKVEVGLYGQPFRAQELFDGLQDSIDQAVSDATHQEPDTQTDAEEVPA